MPKYVKPTVRLLTEKDWSNAAQHIRKCIASHDYTPAPGASDVRDTLKTILRPLHQQLKDGERTPELYAAIMARRIDPNT